MKVISHRSSVISRKSEKLTKNDKIVLAWIYTIVLFLLIIILTLEPELTLELVVSWLRGLI